jgi:molybdenum cofactor cytidylyltransferase
MISCILLSAGLSSRFGSPKALAKINDKHLIEELQNTLISSNIDEIIIVLGAHKEQIKPFLLKHKKVKVVYNKDYNFGQTSSFQVGLKSVSVLSEAVMLLPVDFPFIKIKTINCLIASYAKLNPKILIPSFDNQKGHPPLFSISLKEEFLDLSMEKGINSVSHHYTSETQLVPVNDKGCLCTFNTPEEFEKIKAEII